MPAPTRRDLLKWGVIVEGGLIVAALAAGWLIGIDPWRFHASWWALLWGLGGIVPMLGAFFLSGDIRDVVVRLLGPALAECRWYDLVLLATLAGLGEELLFRGTVELYFEGWHLWGGMLLTNVLFGAAHSLNWQYFVFATVFGVYLSWLSGFPGERNLLPAVIAHGVYDGIAFFLIRAEYLDISPPQDLAGGDECPATPWASPADAGSPESLSDRRE